MLSLMLPNEAACAFKPLIAVFMAPKKRHRLKLLNTSLRNRRDATGLFRRQHKPCQICSQAEQSDVPAADVRSRCLRGIFCPAEHAGSVEKRSSASALLGTLTVYREVGCSSLTHGPQVAVCARAAIINIASPPCSTVSPLRLQSPMPGQRHSRSSRRAALRLAPCSGAWIRPKQRSRAAAAATLYRSALRTAASPDAKLKPDLPTQVHAQHTWIGSTLAGRAEAAASSNRTAPPPSATSTTTEISSFVSDKLADTRSAFPGRTGRCCHSANALARALPETTASRPALPRRCTAAADPAD